MLKKLARLGVCLTMVWIFSSAYALEVQVTQAQQLVAADGETKLDRCHAHCIRFFPNSAAQYDACMIGCVTGPD